MRYLDKTMKSKWLFALIMGFQVLGVMHRLPAEAPSQSQVAILEGALDVEPLIPSKKDPERIQPGTAVKLKVKVKNIGSKPNEEGKIYVQYAYPEPLADQQDSVLFQTESISLPTIFPGQTM